MKVFHICAIGLAFAVVGCETIPEKYAWGDYEEMVSGAFEPSTEIDHFAQVQRLSIDIEKATVAGKPLPPGLYAHLGYMKHLTGDDAGAIEAFKQEIKLYPASKVFVEELIGNLNSKKSNDSDLKASRLQTKATRSFNIRVSENNA